MDTAPETLKALYKVAGGYIAYTVTSTQYVAVETEAITHFDENGRIIRTYLVEWTVGHGVAPGTFPENFEGMLNGEIGSVELVTEATGTSEHYRDAIKAASDYIAINLNTTIDDDLIADAAEDIFGVGCELDITDFAGAKFVSKIYKGNGEYAALIEIETADGARAIEAIVGIRDGKVIGVKIINNFVSGAEGELSYAEMQEYLNSFVGKNIDEVAKAEVKGDSDTAKRIKRAVKASLRNLDKYLTEKAETEKAALYGKIDNVIGFILVAIALPAVPVIVIVTSKKEKRRDE